MTSIDLRRSINAISDVISNRPRPLREFDQIFMKAADMLLQVEHASRHFADKSVVFIGDGDAIALSLVHLHSLGLLTLGPRSVKVLDFDERVVLSVRRFAELYQITDRVSASMYNVADALPFNEWQRYDAFYTNPPFGASNNGASVQAFLSRGMEAVGNAGVGCVVMADVPELDWTQKALRTVQRAALDTGFVISELIPQFHHYHLDDEPDLTSCSLIIKRIVDTSEEYTSVGLANHELENFYGEKNPLRIRYVRDRTNGGKLASRDHELEPMNRGGAS